MLLYYHKTHSPKFNFSKLILNARFLCQLVEKDIKMISFAWIERV